MTSDRRKTQRRLKANAPSSSYEVGYAKPPQATQFTKGESGNPKGRPKGAKNRPRAMNDEGLKKIVLEEAYRTIKLKEGEKNITIPIAKAVVRSVAVNAARGNHRAQQLFTKMLHDTETSDKLAHDEYLKTMIEYKCDWEVEIARCKRLGLPIPDPIPHPDHIEIDFRTSQVIIKGPFSREEKEEWDKLRKRKREAKEAMEGIKKLMQDPDNADINKVMQEDFDHEQRMYSMISRVIKD